MRWRVVIADNPAQSHVEVEIQAASIDTQNAMRDEDLRSENFLNGDQFPVLMFEGAHVVPELDGRWALSGSLTVRDVTLPVRLSGQFLGAIVDPSGLTRIAFEGRAAASRKDFGLMHDLEKESGGILLGKDISIDINAEATLQNFPVV